MQILGHQSFWSPLKLRRALWYPPGYKSFPNSLPLFLFVGNRLSSASLTFPGFQREDSNIYSLAKGGNAEIAKEHRRNNSAAIKQGPGSSSRGVFEFFIRNWGPHAGRRWQLQAEHKIPGTPPCYLITTNQKKVYAQWEKMKTLTPSPNNQLLSTSFLSV